MLLFNSQYYLNPKSKKENYQLQLTPKFIPLINAHKLKSQNNNTKQKMLSLIIAIYNYSTIITYSKNAITRVIN